MSNHYNISGAPIGAPTKVCFKCGVEQPLSCYYTHKQMADGHLNKCKSCTKCDVGKDYKRNVQNPDWVKKERARGREKYYRLEYRERYAPGSKPRALGVGKKELIARYFSRYPEKKRVHNVSQRITPATPGNHLHHWSYVIDNAKDVIELPATSHYTIHRFIVYDQPSMMYRRKDTGELLASRAAHEEYIFSVLGAAQQMAA